MARPPRTGRPYRLFIRLVSPIVPAGERAYWVREWEAEIAYRLDSSRRPAPFALSLRVMGALPDALWIRRQEWSLEMLFQDLKYALRTLRTRPAFTGLAVLTIALGIGTNTAIFSIVEGILLKPVRAPHADRLVMPLETREGAAASFSYENWRDLADKSTSLEASSCFFSQSVNVNGYGEPERIRGLFCESGFFDVMGAPPLLGRSIEAGEDVPGGDRVAVLSYGYWQRKFGGDASALGSTILLNNFPHTIVGVMPPDFRFPFDASDAFISLQTYPNELNRTSHDLFAIALLRDGVERTRAAQEMGVIMGGIRQEHPEVGTDLGIMLMSPTDFFARGGIKEQLVMLLVAVGLLLLIACANVANLQIVRSAGRSREMAVRTALGAGRGRLLRQLFTESALLALLGGLAGVALATQGIRLLLGNAPGNLEVYYRIGIDGRVLAFAVLLSMAAGILFGLLPALRASMVSVAPGLREGGAGLSGERRTGRLRSALVVAQLAIAVPLLVGSLLLVRSMDRLARVDPGFDTEDLLSMEFRLPVNKYGSDPEMIAFFDRMVEAVRSAPGVLSASTAQALPFSGNGGSEAIYLPGSAYTEEEPLGVRLNVVSPGYFETMRIPMLLGRPFRPEDGQDSPLVTVVSAETARRLWPDLDSPVGRTFRARGIPVPIQVIGVAADVRDGVLSGSYEPFIYASYRQAPSRFASIAVRTAGPPLSAADAVRSAVWSVDPDQPIWEVMPHADRVRRSYSDEAFTSFLLGLFAVLAGLLAAVGIYGVISYTVDSRTRELGIRMALGADAREVLALVMRGAGRLTLLGVGIGVVAAIAVSRFLGGLLYGVSPLDPVSYAASVTGLFLIGLLAGWIPARRATRVDPLTALRAE